MKGGQSGFTLLETMVALVVLGLLIVGLGEGVRFGLAARAAEVSLQARGEALDAVDRTLRGLITRADLAAFHARPTLVGSTDWIDFVTDLPASAAVDGIRRAAVTLTVDPAHRLVLGWTLAPHATALAPPPHGRVMLLRDVERIVVSYGKPFTSGGGWVDRWDERFLPALVRLRIVFRNGDRRLWPDIVAAPMNGQTP